MSDIDDSPIDPDLKRTKTSNKVIEALAWIVLIIGFCAFLFLGTPMQDTINGDKFWIIGVCIGVALYIGVIIFLKLKYPSVFDEKSRRKSIYIISLVGLIISTLDVISLINVSFASPLIIHRRFTVVEKTTSREGKYPPYRYVYFIRCDSNGNGVVIQIKKSSWDGINEKDTVELYLKEGYFGSDYVTEYKLDKE